MDALVREGVPRPGVEVTSDSDSDALDSESGSLSFGGVLHSKWLLLRWIS